MNHPHQFPTGISYVIVNGKIVIDESKFKTIKPGVVLKKMIYEKYIRKNYFFIGIIFFCLAQRLKT